MTELGLVSLLLIAVALSADCFAVSLGISCGRRSLPFYLILRLAVAFGLFQSGMLAAGYFAGRTLVVFISGYDHWIAFGLLALVGGRMIWESLHEKENKREIDISRLVVLLTLSVATSIDSLAAGLSLAFLRAKPAFAAGVIGAVAFTITLVGASLGEKLGRLIGERAETIGGVVLIAIGLRILVSHLLE